MKLTISGSADEIKRFINGDASAKVTVVGNDVLGAELLAESQPKFKKGDKVRVIGHRGIPHSHTVGSVGDVDGFSKSSGRPSVIIGGVSQFIDTFDLEIVEQPKLTRADVVAQAKRDVAELLAEIDKQLGWQTTIIPLYKHYGRLRIQFVIDRDKQTVVAIARFGNIPHDNEVLGKGIAKCAPDDVFNADIGKAIALRRALGLDVPTEYLRAPKPEGVAVGDVVKLSSNVFEINGLTETVSGIDSGYMVWTKESAGWIDVKQCEVIDDTDRSEYKADAV